ncbi:hypothetical protein Cgig2_027182 [Carnegiea gigantea]|uniref:Uncharacterized protein n=1 Tax=Carnegiea gigantea TaxID=171969 RepID=A0A9Q1KSS1_9CARY|nr:hypothetical protein Cgig2_027182 [Carnegiea gigantea]
MMDTITRLVSEQVKTVIKAANSFRLLPHFDYVPTVSLGHPMLQRPPSMTATLKPQNVRKYCKFHEQSEHTITECRELKKALHELADRCSTEVVAIIVGGYAKGMTRSALKAQLKSTQQLLTTEQGPRRMVPTMEFGGKEARRFASPHNDPLVVEMKIASAIVRRILIDTGSSVDIITWDCLKKLTYPRRGEPTGMIRLPVRFGHKLKSKNLEVNFLVVDVPMAYNVILGCPTLHKHGPADSLAPWLKPPSQPSRSFQPWPLRAPPLAGTTNTSFRLLRRPDQPLAFPSIAGTESLAPPAFGSPPWLSPPERMLRPLSPPAR